MKKLEFQSSRSQTMGLKNAQSCNPNNPADVSIQPKPDNGFKEWKPRINLKSELPFQSSRSQTMGLKPIKYPFIYWLALFQSSRSQTMGLKINWLLLKCSWSAVSIQPKPDNGFKAAKGVKSKTAVKAFQSSRSQTMGLKTYLLHKGMILNSLHQTFLRKFLIKNNYFIKNEK